MTLPLGRMVPSTKKAKVRAGWDDRRPRVRGNQYALPLLLVVLEDAVVVVVVLLLAPVARPGADRRLDDDDPDVMDVALGGWGGGALENAMRR